MPIKRAPFDAEGNLMHYTDAEIDQQVDRAGEPVEWRDNEPFPMALLLQGAARGRSSAYFIWQNDTGQRFPMFVTDFVDLMRRQGVRKGARVSADWHAVKRGQNYGLALAPDN